MKLPLEHELWAHVPVHDRESSPHPTVQSNKAEKKVNYGKESIQAGKGLGRMAGLILLFGTWWF